MGHKCMISHLVKIAKMRIITNNIYLIKSRKDKIPINDNNLILQKIITLYSMMKWQVNVIVPVSMVYYNKTKD
jgi:hypothetical protein